MHLSTNLGISNGPLSSALARTFRGKLCDVILRNRSVTTFEKGQLIYDAGEENKTFFFLQNRAYRTTPLNGLWTHTKGGFYHDGRFATLADVVNHYDTCFSLGLTAQEQGDIVEYMKSLPRRK